jgi:GNAT superfamily N-acetyltransferase
MADTEHISLVELGVGDAPAGLLLSTEAHWNQNEADWRFFLSQGIVFGVRDGKQLVATAALLPYASANAWISMVLVTANWRRRGIATRLVDACLNAATKRGLTTWLDATPDGARVYGPLGFTPTLQLRRLRLAAPAKAGTARSLSACTLDDFVARDVSAMGFDRSSPLTAGPSSGRSSACDLAAPRCWRQNCRSPSPARNLDRIFSCTTATSNPRFDN